MNNLHQEIKKLSEDYFDEVIKIRRHIHTHPELSFQEYETSKFIASKLTEIGIPFKDKIAQTGIIGTIKGKNPEKRIIALRADMDALPISEKNNIPYKSIQDNVMHACGHDVHSASLLGTAMILNQLKEKFEGTILLIFQPAEEKLPGGAKQILDEGALNNPKPDIVIGQHVYPELEAGKVGLKQGVYMASTDEIYITVRGKGGHAALRDNLIDPIVIASEVILELHKVIPMQNKKDIPTVFSIGKVTANGATNVIPDEVNLEGTLRTLNEEWRSTIHDLIRNTCNQIAKKQAGFCDVNIVVGYPVLINNEDITEKVQQSAIQYLGPDNVEPLEIRMTAEDFAYYSQEFPSTFYRLGVRQGKSGQLRPLHTATFDIDEEALKTGMGTMAAMALDALQFKINIVKA